MSESDLLARIARQMIALEERDAQFDALLQMTAGLVDGSIDRSRVMVDLTNRTVHRSELGQRPALPATINGLPQCVVAPPEPDPIAAIQAAVKAMPD
jgi:hypothetical protein